MKKILLWVMLLKITTLIAYPGNFEADKVSCDSGIGVECYELGKNYEIGKSGIRDIIKAHTFYEAGCNKNYAKACLGLASLYSVGIENIKHNPSKAFKLYLKACNNGNSEACSSVGYAYYWGKGVKKDYSNAKSFYEKACGNQDAYACFSLGVIYRDTKWGNQNYEKARYYISKSCELGDCMGCNHLARMYEIGQGVKKNNEKAEELYANSFECIDAECVKGNIKSCVWLEQARKARIIGDKDRQKVIGLVTRDCNEGRYEACATLGEMYSEGRGVDQDFLLSEKFYAKACDGGHSKSCENLAFTYYADPKNKKALAVELFGKACEGDNPKSCYMLGSMYIEGEAVKQNIQKAKELIKKSCDHGYTEACSTFEKLKMF